MWTPASRGSLPRSSFGHPQQLLLKNLPPSFEELPPQRPGGKGNGTVNVSNSDPFPRSELVSCEHPNAAGHSLPGAFPGRISRASPGFHGTCKLDTLMPQTCGVLPPAHPPLLRLGLKAPSLPLLLTP